MKQTVKSALLDTLPVLSGYLVLGIGFGFLLKSSGFTVLHAFLMSLLIYAGSMQYVAVGLLTGGASLITVALTTLMVNARHLFYGIMGMLVVYCLKSISFTSISGFLPELIACVVTGALYIWRRSTLLSILCGTVCYMLLVQLVF